MKKLKGYYKITKSNPKWNSDFKNEVKKANGLLKITDSGPNWIEVERHVNTISNCWHIPDYEKWGVIVSKKTPEKPLKASLIDKTLFKI
jgi:hypothetical protein